MIRPEWLQDRLVDVLRWQLAHPNGAEDPAAPEVPVAGMRIWMIFLDLSRGRAVGFGPSPISTAEIESYARMVREPIRPFEMEMLRSLDGVLLQFARDAPVPAEPERASSEDIMAGFRKAAGPSVSARPLTPELFDALFSGG